MDIIKENIDALNATIKVHVVKEDYEEKINKVLKDYKRKMNMPGFRPGMVPFNLVKKMYYKPVLADELNNLVIDSVFKYIYDEKLEILGEPLPDEKDEKPIDLDNDTEFDFAFNIGLSPQFDLKVSAKDKIPYYIIKVDKEGLNKAIENIQQRYGDFVKTDVSDDKSFIKGSVIQLDEENNPAEEGIINEDSSLSVAVIKDSKIQSSFVARKENDVIDFDIKKAFPNDTEIAAILKTDKDKSADISGNFRFTIKEINTFKKAEVNQELFDKMYGKDIVKSEEEFKDKITDEMKTMYTNDSDYKFNIDVKDYLVKKHKFDLPAEFLKRWLLKINKEKYSKEDIDKEFDNFEKDLKWQLIGNRIRKENSIEVNEEEIKDHARQVALMQYRQYGISNVPDDILNNYVTQILANEQEKRRIADMVSDQKVFKYLKENVKLDEKEITLEKFNKMFEDQKN